MRASGIALLLVLGLAGCTVEPEPAAIEAGALEGSLGVLHVERSAVDGAGRTVLRAAFARYQGVEGDAVLRLLGSRSPAELGRCALVDPDGDLGVDDADVELLDVGALSVSVADAEARLTPRTFPDLASVLVGVFYAGDAALPMPEPEVDEYHLSAEGGAEVGEFEVIVPAPAAPARLEILGADGTSAPLDGELAEITRAGALTLTWDGEDPRDLVELELAAGGQTLGCVGSDEGSFRIDASDIALLDSDPAARLTVRRVRVSPFDAAGIDVAYARVAAARSLSISVR
jgi:hypothetical protein